MRLGIKLEVQQQKNVSFHNQVDITVHVIQARLLEKLISESKFMQRGLSFKLW